jgi:hypothetical protein
MGFNPWKWAKDNIIDPVVDFVVDVGKSVVNFVGGLVGGMFSTPDLGSVSQASAANEGVLLNRTGTLNNIPVVYGQRKVGGTIVFMDTAGDRNQNLYMAIVLCEGRIESIGKEFIDGVDFNDSRFVNYRKRDKFTGSDDQISKSLLQEAPGWTDDHRLSGLAYLGYKFEMPEIKSQDDADKNPWQGIPRVQALIKGKRVVSAAIAGADTYENEIANATATSSNPADIILDYLRNPRYGRGLSNDRIDFPSFAAARILYNTQVTLADGSTTAYMQMNPVIDTGNKMLDNLKKLLVQARSGLPYQQGKFHLKPENSGSTTSPVDPTPTPVFDIEEKHIIGGVQIVDAGTRNQANQVRVSYIEPNTSGEDNDWSTNEVIYPTTGSARDIEMLAEDQNRRVLKEYNLEYITNGELAAYHAKLLCENERRIKTLTVTCTSELHDVEVGDIVRLKYAPLSINYAFYRVISWQVDENYTISLGLREHTPANYEFDNSITTIGYTRQRQYVGDTQRVTNYAFQGSTGTYTTSTGVTNANLATLPNMNIQTGVTNSNFLINTVTSVAVYDRPGFAYETVQVNMTIPNFLVDSYQIELVEYNANTSSWENKGTLNPGVHRTSGTTYVMEVNVELDGQDHNFKLRCQDPLKNIFFQTATKIYTAISSIFITRITGP